MFTPYIPPTVDQFKAQFFRDFDYAVPSFGAVATAAVTGGVVQAPVLVSGGQYYKTAPQVVITPAWMPGTTTPGPGSGATATATVNAAGQVSSVTLTAAGSGYNNGVTVTFVGGSGDSTNKQQVQDQDIWNAIWAAYPNVNPTMWADQNQWIMGFNLLAAHYLVMNLRASTQGLASQYNWFATSKGAGEFSETFDLPQFIKDNPTLAYIGTTRYGAQYLSLVQPFLVGGIQILFSYPSP